MGVEFIGVPSYPARADSVYLLLLWTVDSVAQSLGQRAF